MKRTALAVFFVALAFLSFYSAYDPDWARRFIPLPISNTRVRSTVHVLVGTLFVLALLLLIWGGVMG